MGFPYILERGFFPDKAASSLSAAPGTDDLHIHLAFLDVEHSKNRAASSSSVKEGNLRDWGARFGGESARCILIR